MTARSALMQAGVRAILVGARAKAKPPHSHQFVGGEAPLCIDLAVLQDEASLYYGGRQRFNFTVQAQRCERAGEVLGERHPTAKTPLITRRKNRS
jgi:hypothetical protein